MLVPLVADNRPILPPTIYSRCFRQRRPQSHCRERLRLKDKQKHYYQRTRQQALFKKDHHSYNSYKHGRTRDGAFLITNESFKAWTKKKKSIIHLLQRLRCEDLLLDCRLNIFGFLTLDETKWNVLSNHTNNLEKNNMTGLLQPLFDQLSWLFIFYLKSLLETCNCRIAFS